MKMEGSQSKHSVNSSLSSLSNISYISHEDNDNDEISSSAPGIWKYSKTRQIAFWMKKSVRNAVTAAPNLNAVYEHNGKETLHFVKDDQDGHGHGVNQKQQQQQRRIEEYRNRDRNDNVIHSSQDETEVEMEMNADTNQHEHEHANANGDTNTHTSLNANVNIENDDDNDDDVNAYDAHVNVETMNIDEAMNALHSFSTPEYEYAAMHYEYQYKYNHYPNKLSLESCSDHPHQQESIVHPYDWILDGDIQTSEEYPASALSMASPTSIDEHDNVRMHISPEQSNADNDNDANSMNTDDELYCALAGMELEVCPNDTEHHNVLNHDHALHACRDDDDDEDDDDAMQMLKSSHDDETECSHDLHSTNYMQHQHQLQRRQSQSYETTSDAREEVWGDIPDFLPFEDPSTPEGRFFRRLQVERDLDVSKKGIGIGGVNVDVDARNFHEGDVDVPAEYLGDDFRSTFLDILNSIPWDDDDHDHEEAEEASSSSDTSDIDARMYPMEESMKREQYLIEKLSSLDELSRNVTDALRHKAKQKEHEIHLETRRIQAIDYDITRALSCARQAESCLQRARGRGGGGGGGGSGADDVDSHKHKPLHSDSHACAHGGSRDGVLGGMYILEEAGQRDKLRQVDDLLKSIEELVIMEASVFEFVDDIGANLMAEGGSGGSGGSSSGEGSGLHTLLQTCDSLKNRLLKDERFLRLRCLDESRERVSHIMEFSCHRIEEELMTFLFRTCRRGMDGGELNGEDGEASCCYENKSMTEYQSLLDARIIFDGYRAEEAIKNDTSLDSASLSESFATVWSSCILTGLCFEADRCLPRAVADPTPLNGLDLQERSTEFDANLAAIKMNLEEIQSFTEDAASLRTLTKNLLSIRLEFDENTPNFVGTFHKLCSSLAEVLHAHYVISEWHKDQIDDACSRSAEVQRFESNVQNDEGEKRIEVERIEVITKDDFTKSTSSSNSSRSSGSSQQIPVQTSKTEAFPDIPHSISGPQSSDLGGNSDMLHPNRPEGLRKSILETRGQLWNHCEGVLVEYLDAITAYNEKKDSSNWSRSWIQELDSFHDICKLCDQMEMLGKEFMDGQQRVDLSSEGPESKCALKSALNRLFEKFVKDAHVESMTELGTMMASETWDLLPIEVETGSHEDPKHVIQSGIQSFLSNVTTSLCAGSCEESSKLWHNQLVPGSEGLFFAFFSNRGNPFTPNEEYRYLYNENIEICSDSSNPYHEAASNPLYAKVASYISQNDELVLGTKSALNGLARWTMRLLRIQAKLPVVSLQITGVICNLYDLYFLTIFRLCVGNSKSEAIVLGSEMRSDSTFNERFPKDIPPSASQCRKSNSRQIQITRTNSFNRRRNQTKEAAQAHQSKLLSVLNSKFCEADINAPLPTEQGQVSKARKFIHRGQAALSAMVSLDQIENWSLCHDGTPKSDEQKYAAKCLESLIAGASSCLFVACLFDTAIHSMPPAIENSGNCGPLLKYLDQMIDAVCTIYNLSLRMCGTRVAIARRVVSSIIVVGNGWSDSKLNEHCNGYIDRLSDRYGVLWAHLSSSPLPKRLLFNAWEYVVESGYLALLEGFSKIFDCSTEGRALMSMDLATFSSNVNKPTQGKETGTKITSFHPPAVVPRRGMQYVDTYIKVFYFPTEDILKWVDENKNRYHMSHLMALVSIGVHNQVSPTDLALCLSRREAVSNAVNGVST